MDLLSIIGMWILACCFIAGLLLLLAGATASSVIENYTFTDTCLKPLYDAGMMGTGASHATPDRMESMLETVESYGGINEYLVSAAAGQMSLHITIQIFLNNLTKRSMVHRL